LQKRDREQKTQNEAYKYKLQYLELSQKELQKERKRWQDKEREYEKSLVALTAELRELKLEHQQAVDLHEAFRAHVEAKESARQMETSNWDIKRQALVAEHQLALKQSETGKNARVAQLERELQKVKSELDDAQEEVERLTVALEAGVGLPDDIKASRSSSSLLDEQPEEEKSYEPKGKHTYETERTQRTPAVVDSAPREAQEAPAVHQDSAPVESPAPVAAPETSEAQSEEASF